MNQPPLGTAIEESETNSQISKEALRQRFGPQRGQATTGAAGQTNPGLIKMIQIHDDHAELSTPLSPAFQAWTRDQDGGETLLRWSKQPSNENSGFETGNATEFPPDKSK